MNAISRPEQLLQRLLQGNPVTPYQLVEAILTDQDPDSLASLARDLLPAIMRYHDRMSQLPSSRKAIGASRDSLHNARRELQHKLARTRAWTEADADEALEKEIRWRSSTAARAESEAAPALEAVRSLTVQFQGWGKRPGPRLDVAVFAADLPEHVLDILYEANTQLQEGIFAAEAPVYASGADFRCQEITRLTYASAELDRRIDHRRRLWQQAFIFARWTAKMLVTAPT